MAKQKTKGKTATPKFTRVHSGAAGVDVGSTFHVAAVSPSSTSEPVRSFRSFTSDLQAMADWLQGHGVTTVAMESTGIYWIPLFEILESRGFEVFLVNARDAKNVPGRKTDVNDAQWLQQLHEYGLLRASFRPREDIARLRTYMRLRDRMIEHAASHIQHMQKALMQMNVQLHHVVTDVTGATGMRIIRAIAAGETDPAVLAKSRDLRCKSSQETIREALSGNYRLSMCSGCARRLNSTTSIRPSWPNAITRSRPACDCSTRAARNKPSRCRPFGMRQIATNLPSMYESASIASSVLISARSTASARTPSPSRGRMRR